MTEGKRRSPSASFSAKQHQRGVSTHRHPCDLYGVQQTESDTVINVSAQEVAIGTNDPSTPAVSLSQHQTGTEATAAEDQPQSSKICLHAPELEQPSPTEDEASAGVFPCVDHNGDNDATDDMPPTSQQQLPKLETALTAKEKQCKDMTVVAAEQQTPENRSTTASKSQSTTMQ